MTTFNSMSKFPSYYCNAANIVTKKLLRQKAIKGKSTYETHTTDNPCVLLTVTESYVKKLNEFPVDIIH